LPITKTCPFGEVTTLVLTPDSKQITHAIGPEPILLWPEGAPGAIGQTEEDRPSLRIYTARPDAPNPIERANGAGIVICPGGGYGVLAMDHEGHQVAQWLNSVGISAFVLRYRLGPRYRHPAPLLDVQRAIRYVRAHADELGVSAARIGVMGFSAGGHLASTAATLFEPGRDHDTDPVERQSSRPDLAILAYPVISLDDEFTHVGSRENLLGDRADDPALRDRLSTHRRVTSGTPPTFLFHTDEDSAVPVENSLAFYAALRRAGVPAELHVYAFGPHGVGLGSGDPTLSTWKERLFDWLRSSGFLSDGERAAVSGSVTLDGHPLRFGTITFSSSSLHDPVAWAAVNRGSFSISAARGPVPGTHDVVVRNLGQIEPEVTVESVRGYPVGTREIAADDNELPVDVRVP